MTIEELFGTLQQAVIGSWRKHLRTAKYGKHEALDEFYKEMPEKVDALIEGWMGAHGKKISNFENLLKSANYNTLSYLKELKKICKDGYDLLDENEELEGLLDDIVNLINTTLYKVKELSESSVIDLRDYIMEQLTNNATDDVDASITESLSKSDEKALYDCIYSTIDYLYQEGVIEYDDHHLRAFVQGKNTPDYNDIVNAVLSENVLPKCAKILQAYLNSEDNKDAIERIIMKVIKDIDSGNKYF